MGINRGAQTRSVVFQHVAVVDVVDGKLLRDTTVAVSGEQITALGNTGTLPDGAQVVDARGKFLIPGLWDMHTHLFVFTPPSFHKSFLQLYVTNGITSVRTCGDSWDLQQHWRQAIAEGSEIGPRIMKTSPIIDGPVPVIPNSPSPFCQVVKDAEDGRRMVDVWHSRGVDIFKVYSMLTREIYLAMLDQARQKGVTVIGHLPPCVTAVEASRAGQKSFEHFFGIWEACSSREHELLDKERQTWSQNASTPRAAHSFGKALADEEEAIESYDESKAASFFAEMIKNGTFFVPTMVIEAISQGLYQPSDPRLKYVPQFARELLYDTSPTFAAFTAEQRRALGRVYEHSLKLIVKMHRLGIPVVPGTDMPLPGFILHDEIAEFVKAGFTPAEALKAATVVPAKFFGISDSMGTIDVGKVADLVLLDANPLDDINAIRKILGVVARGRWLPGAELDMLKLEIQSAAETEESRRWRLH